MIAYLQLNVLVGADKLQFCSASSRSRFSPIDSDAGTSRNCTATSPPTEGHFYHVVRKVAAGPIVDVADW